MKLLLADSFKKCFAFVIIESTLSTLKRSAKLFKHSAELSKHWTEPLKP